MNRKKLKVLWSVLVLGILALLINQLRFIDHSNYVGASEKIPDGKTVFLTIEESSPSLKKSGFSGLEDSLKLWEYDKETKIVHLREKSLIPTDHTPLLVIYDKGNDKYTDNQNIMPISTFPFSMENTGAAALIKSVQKDGTVTFSYRDKKLSLKPGQTYREIIFEDFKIKKITIKNYGLYDQKQFKQIKSK